jgi:hypothetical protein
LGCLSLRCFSDGILTRTLENISAVTLGIGMISFPYEIFLVES